MSEARTIDPRVLSTLNEDGTRRWIRPRPSRGRFLSARRIVAWVLILLFTAIPYVSVNGRPLVLLDLASRRFTIFGATFLPTDTLLLAILLLGIVVGIFLLTALFGRVWCGWACPQTVYMEFLFRPIERLFEGTPGRARAGLARRLGGAGRLLKFGAYLLVSLYLAHTFLAYFVGVDRLALWVTRSPLEHPVGFLVVAVTTGLMLLDFGYFREQVCLVACPYGRLQAALLDRSSLIITYDPKRGEPRGRMRRTVATPAALTVGATGPAPQTNGALRHGDCVDCGMCVVTCPTGIDIRNGLQMECIGCAQCIDACDAVMARLKRPLGLIRYATQAGIEGGSARILRPRAAIYAAILLVIAGAFTLAVVARPTANVVVVRGLGRPYTALDGGMIGNPVKIKLVSRTTRALELGLSAEGIPGARLAAETNPVRLPPGASAVVPAMVEVPEGSFVGGRCGVTLRIAERGAPGLDHPTFSREIRYTLVGPAVPTAPGETP